MKKSAISILVSTGVLLSSMAVANTTGSEILAVQSGGTPNKVYQNNKPTLKVATYNIGKNEVSADVTNFDKLN